MTVIQTNIAVPELGKNVYKKFKSLSVNEEPRIQGDGILRISPFDDYFIFTLYNDVDNENVPINITNVGTLYLSFIGKSDEIRIPNYTKVQDVDLAQGQVLFKITKEDSKKILALDNNNFYLSSKMVDEDGESDESIIYTGKFLSYDAAAVTSSTETINNLAIEYSKELGIMQSKIDSLNTTIKELESTISQLSSNNSRLKTSNEELSDQVKVLSGELGTKKAEATLEEAKLAQAESDVVKNQRNMTDTTRNKFRNAQTNVSQTAQIQQAANSLQQTIPGINIVTHKGGGNTYKPNLEAPR